MPPCLDAAADDVGWPRPRFAVGLRTITSEDPSRPSRRLVTDVWYPVAARDVPADASPTTYDFLADVRPPARLALGGDLPAAPGAFPLVVYSHGRGGLRFIASFLTETLASHGFVVAAPDHAGDTAVDAFLGTALSDDENLAVRPRDLRAVIGALLEGRGDASWLAGHLDPTRLGIAGHSFGATTALALAADHGGGVDHPPVHAVVGMASYTRPLTDACLREVRAPTLLLSGTADRTTPITLDTERPWSMIPGRPLWRVDLRDAGHQSFSDVCAYRDLLDTVPGLPQPLRDAVEAYAADGCGPGLLDVQTAWRFTCRYTLAFLSRVLTTDADAMPSPMPPPEPDEDGLVVRHLRERTRAGPARRSSGRGDHHGRP